MISDRHIYLEGNYTLTLVDCTMHEAIVFCRQWLKQGWQIRGRWLPMRVTIPRVEDAFCVLYRDRK